MDLVFCAIWVVNGVVWSRRYWSLMELYGPDVIVLLMNLWVFNGVVKIELYGLDVIGR